MEEEEITNDNLSKYAKRQLTFRKPAPMVRTSPRKAKTKAIKKTKEAFGTWASNDKLENCFLRGNKAHKLLKLYVNNRSDSDSDGEDDVPLRKRTTRILRNRKEITDTESDDDEPLFKTSKLLIKQQKTERNKVENFKNIRDKRLRALFSKKFKVYLKRLSVDKIDKMIKQSKVKNGNINGSNSAA